MPCAQRSAIVAAARHCIGARFRLHGRQPETGLDCVGLAAYAYRAAGARISLPHGYSLRGQSRDAVTAMLAANRFERLGGSPGAGDLLLGAPGFGQLHLAIATDVGMVHADLAMRRVVERPGAVPWPVIGAWRWRGENRKPLD